MPLFPFDILLSLPAFALVLTRVSGLMITAPLFASSVIPARIRVAMVVALAAMTFPLATRHIPADITLSAALVGGVGELMIANRTMARADDLAQGLDGRVVPFLDIEDALSEAVATVLKATTHGAGRNVECLRDLLITQPTEIVQQDRLSRALGKLVNSTPDSLGHPTLLQIIPRR